MTLFVIFHWLNELLLADAFCGDGCMLACNLLTQQFTPLLVYRTIHSTVTEEPA
jgi:hypothetical protein